MTNAPFVFNLAALTILPLSVLLAKTATAQLDAVWDIADNPATPPDRAKMLAKLAAKMVVKMKPVQPTFFA